MSSYPSFTSLSEVVTHLNATGPDSNSNYLVYGLTVSSNSVQDYVDHANTYIGSLVPSCNVDRSALPVCAVSRLRSCVHERFSCCERRHAFGRGRLQAWRLIRN